MEKRKLLVIDDDVPFGKLTRLNLEQTGNFEVEVQSDSTKALETAREFKPDIILLDIVMPGLDGGDVERLLKADPYLGKVPVILVSAIVSESDAGGSGPVVQSGGDVMLPKTVGFDVLLKCIEDRISGVL